MNSGEIQNYNLQKSTVARKFLRGVKALPRQGLFPAQGTKAPFIAML